jgi:hypothetical protein
MYICVHESFALSLTAGYIRQSRPTGRTERRPTARHAPWLQESDAGEVWDEEVAAVADDIATVYHDMSDICRRCGEDHSGEGLVEGG